MLICEKFHFKKDHFSKRTDGENRNARPKMLGHRHKSGPREVSSTPSRYMLAGRGLGAHRKSFVPSSESLFFVFGLLLQMVANGRKWSQMGAKDIKLTVLLYLQALTYPIDMYFHIFLIVTCTRICWPLARIFDSQLDTMLHTYLIVTCTDIWYPLARIFVDYLYAYLMATYTHIC